MYGEAYPTGGLDLLALVIESPRNDRLGAIFVCGGSLRGERINGIIEILIIGPVLVLAVVC